MKNNTGYVLSLFVCAGGVCSGAMGSDTPTTLSPSRGTVIDAAHIYFNIATGERVVTILGDGQTAGVDTGLGGPIWSSLVDNQCAELGYTTTWFWGADDNSDTPNGLPATSLSTDITVLDFGDIALDTVIDCVHIDWVTAHADTDADSDGLGDGVPGLSGEWTYWDADNGDAADGCTRLPLISFILLDLPGNIFGDDQLTGYTADIDLTANFTGTDLTFEIGDSDGDLQGASFGHNNVDTNSDGVGDGVSVANADRNFDGLPDSDLDGDGRFDFAWTVRFSQPGTRDLDGDGNIDGDINASHQVIGLSFGAGEGAAVDNGDGTWDWVIDDAAPAAAHGQEDLFAIYAPPLGGPDGDILYGGLFWFGGFECASAPLPGGPGYTPAANFEHVLYGPSGVPPFVCVADMNGDSSLNFFDISTFLTLFNAQDSQADVNNDGSFNFFDISTFLTLFGEGCVFP